MTEGDEVIVYNTVKEMMAASMQDDQNDNQLINQPEYIVQQNGHDDNQSVDEAENIVNQNGYNKEENSIYKLFFLDCHHTYCTGATWKQTIVMYVCLCV